MYRVPENFRKTTPPPQESAPPTFVLTIGIEHVQKLLRENFPSATLLHGSTELECHQAVRPGDVLTATTRISNVRERQGKMGKTTFLTLDTVYENQRQELAASCRQMIITY